MVLDSMKGHEAKRAYRERRAAALVELRARAERGEADCIARLIAATAHDPALLGMHVWMIEQAAFERPGGTCRRHVAQAAAWSGASLPIPGRADLGWLLDARTGGARLAAWLYAVCRNLDGFDLSGPDPYGQPAMSRAAIVPNSSQMS